MEIYLIRHTTPDIEKGICYGQADVPLKSSFEEEANSVIQNLPENMAIIYTSPLSRCLQLADYLATKLAVPVVKDERLKELNFGTWEMKQWDEIDKISLDKWMADFVNGSPPQGESFTELATRVSVFKSEVDTQPEQKIIVVTHDGVIRSLLCEKKGIPLRDAFSLPCHYASITRL
jgi:alpha-ribazole phosphatase